ncbi:peptidoglycan-associated outer membrane lipoprotein precursor, partial [Xanthomonas oryzae pv. oryzae]
RSAPTGTGAVLGGIVGAVAGRQISKDTGGSTGNKNISAVAGAAAGALAGNAIQNNVTSSSFDVQVRMDDGRVIVVNQRDLAGVRENAYVRVVNGKVVLR